MSPMQNKSNKLLYFHIFYHSYEAQNKTKKNEMGKVIQFLSNIVWKNETIFQHKKKRSLTEKFNFLI